MFSEYQSVKLRKPCFKIHMNHKKKARIGHSKEFFCICSCESARKRMQKKKQKCKKIPKRNLTIEKFCSIISLPMHAEFPNDETCIEENRPQGGL